MELNENWTYKEIMRNIREVRKSYILMCQSFDYYHIHDRVEYRRKVKNIVYSYPFNEARRNYIWYRLNRNYLQLVRGR